MSKLTPKQRITLREMFGGRCAYCGEVLQEKGWHADHVEAVERKMKYDRDSGRFVATGEYYKPENDRKDNLFPSCHACNINKSSMPLETWRKFLIEGPESLASYNGRFRHMLRFGIVRVSHEPFLFWFEIYEREKQACQTPAPLAVNLP